MATVRAGYMTSTAGSVVKMSRATGIAYDAMDNETFVTLPSTGTLQ